VFGMSKAKNNDLKHEMKSIKNELAATLIENMIKTKRTVTKSDEIEKLQNTSLDVLLLIDEFKTRFEKIGEIAKEIAAKDGRTIVTYEDAEKALKQIPIKK
jgi:histone H3/H4